MSESDIPQINEDVELKPEVIEETELQTPAVIQEPQKPKKTKSSKINKKSIDEPQNEITLIPIEPELLEQPTEPTPKSKAKQHKEPKPKSKARAKKTATPKPHQPEQTPEPQEQEQTPEPEKVKKPSAQKLEEKGVCHHCNKTMTIKALKYTHPNKCHVLKKIMKKKEEEEHKALEPMVPKIDKSEASNTENKVEPEQITQALSKTETTIITPPKETVVMKKKNIFEIRNDKINNIFKNAL